MQAERFEVRVLRLPLGCLSDRRRCEPIGENCWTIRDGGGAADVLPFAGYERLRCQQHRQTQMARWWNGNTPALQAGDREIDTRTRYDCTTDSLGSAVLCSNRES